VAPTTSPPREARRLAVVTGASAGIGAALARLLSARGRPVLAVARREERLLELAERARAAGGAPVTPLALDVAAAGAPARLVEAARAQGGAAWLVNNAGFGMYGAFERASPARVAEMIRLNCEALVAVTHAFLPDLRAAGGGRILNVASVAGFQPTPYMAAYGATKAFVLSFSEALHEELREAGISVGAFCPGPVSTEFGAVAGVGSRFERVPARLSADEAAAAALAQLEAGDAVRVPTTFYGLTTRAVGFLPRALVRRLAGRVQRERS
jgi:short-subunit dehydrogenase